MSSTNIYVTNVSSKAVNSESLERTVDPVLTTGLDEFYKTAIDVNSMTRAVSFAIEQPTDVAINKMIICPTIQFS